MIKIKDMYVKLDHVSAFKVFKVDDDEYELKFSVGKTNRSLCSLKRSEVGDLILQLGTLTLLEGQEYLREVDGRYDL